MKKLLHLVTLGLALVVAPSALLADDLTGAQSFLCTAVQANVSFADGESESGPPWNWNIPQFIQVNLAGMKLTTTKASGENRATEIKNLVRDGGLIVIQGYELGRAFSFVIDEKTGRATVAVAREGRGVTIFGACTPMAEPK